MLLSAGQQRLIRFLIAESTALTPDLERRWGKAAPDALRYAVEHNRLLLLRDWTADILMAPDGGITWFDREATQRSSEASPWEEHMALYRGLFHYPELVAVLPPRPMDAQTCPECQGAGLSPYVFEHPELRNVTCGCGGAGWVSSNPGKPHPIP